MVNSTFSIHKSILLVAASLATFSLVTSLPMISAEIVIPGSTNSSTTSSQNNNNNIRASINNTIGLNQGSPLIVEHVKRTSATNINQDTTAILFQGNATIMLPVGNVSVADEGSSIIKSMQGFSVVSGHTLYKTKDGQENATVSFTGYLPNNATTVFGIAYIQTNSATGQRLAQLNNTIAVFKNELLSPTKSLETFWRWQ
jgi:hypothetical protein